MCLLVADAKEGRGGRESEGVKSFFVVDFSFLGSGLSLFAKRFISFCGADEKVW